MTYTTKELAGVVSADVLAWRSWRRQMKLTIPEAAAMADVSDWHLQRIETGKTEMGERVRTKLRALMERWDESHRPTKPARARVRR